MYGELGQYRVLFCLSHASSRCEHPALPAAEDHGHDTLELHIYSLQPSAVFITQCIDARIGVISKSNPQRTTKSQLSLHTCQCWQMLPSSSLLCLVADNDNACVSKEYPINDEYHVASAFAVGGSSLVLQYTTTFACLMVRYWKHLELFAK